jgi:16S rRNA (cytosine1402-N4)-methyltransferase
MTARSDRHIPVMLQEVCTALRLADGQRIIDGTFGAGGYSRAILDLGASVIGIDRDPDAIAAAVPIVEQYKDRLRLVEAPFSQLDTITETPIDGVVLDIGVSSMQLDDDHRGFSFRHDGPLDMRMAQTGVSAADVVNRAKVGDLIRIIGIYGEEKQASRVARMIERRRGERPFETTRDLANAIEALMPRRHDDRIHPATRTFQGLRIYINDELGELARALLAAERVLGGGGRLVVVTFHSLEDRIVKRFLASRSGKAGGSRHLPDTGFVPAQFEVDPRSPLTAGEDELAVNPRARSAKLRAATRTAVAPGISDFKQFGLPDLPPIHIFGG